MSSVGSRRYNEGRRDGRDDAGGACCAAAFAGMAAAGDPNDDPPNASLTLNSPSEDGAPKPAHPPSPNPQAGATAAAVLLNSPSGSEAEPNPLIDRSSCNGVERLICPLTTSTFPSASTRASDASCQSDSTAPVVRFTLIILPRKGASASFTCHSALSHTGGGPNGPPNAASTPNPCSETAPKPKPASKGGGDEGGGSTKHGGGGERDGGR